PSGDLRWAITQANANTNSAGTLIDFDPTIFSTPQTITLSSPLTLSETAGPEVINGPGASLVTVSGNHAVQVFSISSGVTATLTNLTISGGLASHGGGLYIAGGTVSLTGVQVMGNQAVGTPGWYPSGTGGSAQGGGIYQAGGSLTLKSDVVRSNGARGGAG